MRCCNDPQDITKSGNQDAGTAMTELFREFSDVYLQSLAIMKERSDAGFPNNEEILFFEEIK